MEEKNINRSLLKLKTGYDFALILADLEMVAG